MKDQVSTPEFFLKRPALTNSENSPGGLTAFSPPENDRYSPPLISYSQPDLNSQNNSLQLKEEAGDQLSKEVRNLETSRKIISDKPASVKTGTVLNYSLIQLNQELWAGDKDFSYNWMVFNEHNTAFINTTTPYPSLQCITKNPGNYTVKVQLLNKGMNVPGATFFYSQNVYMEKENTELGGLSVGNFDFKYDGKKVDVLVKVKFKFENSIAEANQNIFKSKFLRAISRYWGSHGKVIEGTSDNGSTFDVPVSIDCREVSDNSYHKVVDVTKDYRRCKVIDEINVYEAVSEETIAHEFGHVLGLDDEYDGGWLENIMFWHDDGKHQSDTKALMNSGGEMRDRYFNLYKNAVESTSPMGYTYKIK